MKNTGDVRTYEVVNYSDAGHEILRRPALSAEEAMEKARETPHSSITLCCANGWVLCSLVFSPKHPPDQAALKKLIEVR